MFHCVGLIKQLKHIIHSPREIDLVEGNKNLADAMVYFLKFVWHHNRYRCLSMKTQFLIVRCYAGSQSVSHPMPMVL